MAAGPGGGFGLGGVGGWVRLGGRVRVGVVVVQVLAGQQPHVAGLVEGPESALERRRSRARPPGWPAPLRAAGGLGGGSRRRGGASLLFSGAGLGPVGGHQDPADAGEDGSQSLSRSSFDLVRDLLDAHE